MSLQVIPVTTKAALRRFIGLPAVLYAGLPGFVAPIRMDRRIILDPARGPFFRKGRAQYWIAERNGRPVGRISAQLGGDVPKGVSPGSGHFGAIDALDDAEAISALLHTAEDWLRAEGCTSVFGPCLLSMNGEPGLMVSGQNEPPMIMAPWHPAYLEKHLHNAGYLPVKDLHNWRLDRNNGKLAALSEQARKNAARMQVTIRSLNMKNIGHDLAVMCDIYNDAWRDNWGFVPLGREDLTGIEKEMKPFLRSEAGIIVEQAGEPVAVMLILPNTFELSADLGMDPSPLGWLKLGLRSLRPRFQGGRIILMGIKARMRQSVGGAAIAMSLIDELGRRFADYSWSYVEGGWVLEDNTALNRILEAGGFRRSRTFRLFEKPLLPQG
jgi:hypothetical protein